MSEKDFIVGLDLGSVSVNAVVIDSSGQIIYEEPYTRHSGQPLQIARKIVKKIIKKFSLRYLAVTGANGEILSQVWQVPYMEEVIAQARGTHHLDPQIKTVIDIGGTDAKFISLDEGGQVKDFGMNTGCASGTGSFLDQQAKRLQLNIEGEFAREALKSTSAARLAGRCAVFAKTDMIHLQQKATPTSDITMGLCEALARSYKSNIARGKEFQGPIFFEGGVAANQAMLIAFKKILKRTDIIVPAHFYSITALGAALLLEEDKKIAQFNPDYLKRDFPQVREKGALPPLSPDPEEKKIVSEKSYAGNLFSRGQSREAYLGIDIGSVSTNVVIIDSQKRLLAKSYLPTAGKPIKAVQEGLKEVKKQLGEKIIIRGVGSTGSGRYLIGSFVGADVIKNEITTQAKGALNIDPRVDTIFEIGGQDSKYISLKDGVIIDFTMNKACAAGTGSFLEEQAEELHIKIREQFEKIAFSSSRPADLGDRCTVFMESSLHEHLQRGTPVPDLVAGLAYSIGYNYLNKVIENRRIGQTIFFQGGTACNKSVVAAFRNILPEKKISVPPHNEVLGAIGVAIVALEEGREESKFKGFGLSETTYRMDSFECQDCPNHCKVNQVWIEGEDKPLTYGDRCDKYSGRRRERKISRPPNLFREREKLLFSISQVSNPFGKIGIPRALHTWELFPLWESFFSKVGLEVILSDRTNDEIIHKGVEVVTAETCFPIKVAHGHVLNLLEKKIDYLFLPSLIDFQQTNKNLRQSYNCPWSQSLPYMVNSAISLEKYPTKVLQPQISLRLGMEKSLREMGKELGVSQGKLKQAIKTAQQTQTKFYQELQKRGARIIKELGDTRGFVIISRPYNGCDPGLNMDIVEKMRDMGMLAIPMDFLNLDPVEISKDYPNMYWGYGQKILTVAREIKKTKNLYPIYITNFGCGPDSFIIKYFAQEMDRPFLELQIDEHSAEAGIITRLEAFLDSIQNRQTEIKKFFIPSQEKKLLEKDRVIHIPYMDDHSYALKAAFEALGQKAEVMELSDLESLRESRKFTSGRECYPCILTTGDMLKVLKRSSNPQRVAFFMGTAQGPCRFGQYKTFQEQIFRRNGFGDIPVISLDSENSYGGYGVKFSKLAWEGIVAIDILRKVQRIIRPEEISPGETNKVYRKYLNKICSILKEGNGLTFVMREAAREFAEIKRHLSNKTVVTIVGEIYVRHNPYSNRFIIKELEKLGLKVELASMREWFLYTNEMHKETSLQERKLSDYFKNRARNLFQEIVEKKLEEPFKNLIQGFEEPSTEEILQLGEKYVHRSLRGESILSIGKIIHSIKRGRDGAVNVMPFTCMPGNLVSAIATKIEKGYPGFPLLSLSYDGSPQANYLNKIRTFVSQAENYHQKKMSKKYHLTPG